MTAPDVYRERAHLVAYMAAQYPAVMAYNDPAEPDWPVVYVKTPRGQLSWHIAPDDVGLFDHVTKVNRHAITWDGHSTEEKYRRLRELTGPRFVPVVQPCPKCVVPDE